MMAGDDGLEIYRKLGRETSSDSSNSKDEDETFEFEDDMEDYDGSDNESSDNDDQIGGNSDINYELKCYKYMCKHMELLLQYKTSK